MVASDIPEHDALSANPPQTDAGSGGENPQESLGTAVQEEAKPKLKFEYDVESVGACKRRIIVTIPREEVDRYFAEELDKIRNEATVPGFRPGRAPRRLLEKRFRSELEEPVKSRLMLDSFWSLIEEAKLAPIGDPDLDPDDVELPEEGDFAFEFTVEVRPEFQLPQWRGLKLQRKVFELTPEYVDRAMQQLVQKFTDLAEVNGPAEMGDYIECEITLRHEGRVLNSADDERIQIRPTLTFLDGIIRDFGEKMVGVRQGESRFCDVEVSESCADPNLAGKTVQAHFKVHKVLRPQTAQSIEEIARVAGYDSPDLFRKSFEDQLRARMELRVYEDLRKQILDQLLDVVPFDLPEDLVRKQTEREIRGRAVELTRSGYTAEEIRRELNLIAREAREVVVRLLREHFLLERLAEEEKIEASEQDIEEEIQRIARMTMRSPRQVRAEYEQENAWDVLRNAIVERKVIDRIVSEAEVTDVQMPLPVEEPSEETALDMEVVRQVPEREEESTG